MKINKLAFIVSIVLVFLGVMGMLVRWSAPTEENKTGEYKNFKISYTVDYLATEADAKISIFLPNDTPNYRIAGESMSYQNLMVDNAAAKQKRGRQVVGVGLRKERPSKFTASFNLTRQKRKLTSAPLSMEERQFYLKDEIRIQRTSPLILKEADLLLAPKIKTEDLITRIFDYSRNQIERSSEMEANDASPS